MLLSQITVVLSFLKAQQRYPVTYMFLLRSVATRQLQYNIFWLYKVVTKFLCPCSFDPQHIFWHLWKPLALSQLNIWPLFNKYAVDLRSKYFALQLLRVVGLFPCGYLKDVLIYFSADTHTHMFSCCSFGTWQTTGSSRWTGDHWHWRSVRKNQQPRFLFKLSPSFPFISFNFQFTFMHLADSSIQTYLKCIQAIPFINLCVSFGNQTSHIK